MRADFPDGLGDPQTVLQGQIQWLTALFGRDGLCLEHMHLDIRQVAVEWVMFFAGRH